ncbi:MAG: replication-associated recombination protein A [Cyanobacteriota/Melainabacteria group bacterium]|nr:replication-associated recombination protein A [Cyanobacteria bacterium HKST-UBA01]MCB9469712.1 replication-associated recombination protein A [Candidatus Obscuribacterales bacterium]
MSIEEGRRIPLAERMRPSSLDEIVGQSELLEEGGILKEMLRSGQLSSFVLWGPPGVGKTTIARTVASSTNSKWISFSAVVSGIKEIKNVMAEADAFMKIEKRQTVLFVDEIHRFNKAQQDAFLPYVEAGTIILVGATTENPSFEINSALLSRLKVFVLTELSLDELKELLRRALTDKEKGLGESGIDAEDSLLESLAVYSSGDARTALNSLELACLLAGKRGAGTINEKDVKQAVQQAVLKYDKGGEQHYNLISALHKSIRNSDPDASLYWLARMLEAGEEPRYIARRLVRFASEDIGLASPSCLPQAVAAMQAVDFIGMPEGKLALAQAVVYMALAPKSNSIYVAYQKAASDAINMMQHPVPMHLRNAPTRLMKDLGYSKGYKYAHDYEEGIADMQCLPEKLAGKKYFRPGARGFEGKLPSG